MASWHVYMVRCADDSLYTGCTNDLAKRVAAHNAGKGARYTRSRGPVEVVLPVNKIDFRHLAADGVPTLVLFREVKSAVAAGC